MTWHRDLIETGCLIAIALLLAANAYEMWRLEARARMSLERDGYTGIEMIGSVCKIATATDKDGERGLAYACTWDNR